MTWMNVIAYLFEGDSRGFRRNLREWWGDTRGVPRADRVRLLRAVHRARFHARKAADELRDFNRAHGARVPRT